MAVTNVSLFGAAFLTPVVVGRVTKVMGWQWSFYFVAIFLALALPLMVFFVPETAFRRPDYLNLDYRLNNCAESTNTHAPLGDATNEGTKPFAPEIHGANGSSRTEVSAALTPRKDSLGRSMRLFNGRKTDDNFFKLLLRPLPLFFHPGVFWVGQNSYFT